MSVDKTRVRWNLIRAEESVLDVEPGSIEDKNTGECFELLSAGGNQPAHSESSSHDELGGDYAQINSRVRDELRLSLSRAGCQVS